MACPWTANGGNCPQIWHLCVTTLNKQFSNWVEAWKGNNSTTYDKVPFLTHVKLQNV